MNCDRLDHAVGKSDTLTVRDAPGFGITGIREPEVLFGFAGVGTRFVVLSGTRGRFGTDGRGRIAGRDDGVGFLPGIVCLDGASSRLKRRR